MDVNFFIAKRMIREFERSQLHFISSIEDLDLVWAIGYAQKAGKPMGLKALSTGEFGSPKTIQRRLERLRQLDIIGQQRSDCDARRVEFLLTERTLAQIELYRRFIVKNGVVARETVNMNAD
ncbi:MAG: hypothetical protein WED00_17145 [Aquisalimonadaceae bacterium]